MAAVNTTFYDNVTNISASYLASPEVTPEYGKKIAFFVMVPTILILNVAAFVFISVAKSLKKPLKILIKSQVISDMLLMVMLLMFSTFEIYKKVESPFCFPIIISIFAMASTSFFTCSLYAVLNYVCVLRPLTFRSSVTTKLTSFLVLAVWLTSFAFAVLAHDFHVTGGYCIPMYRMKRHGSILTGVTLILCGASVVVFNTLTIINILRKSRKTAPCRNRDKRVQDKNTYGKTNGIRSRDTVFYRAERKHSLQLVIDSCSMLCNSAYSIKNFKSKKKYLHSFVESKVPVSSRGDKKPQCFTEIEQNKDMKPRNIQASKQSEILHETNFSGICLPPTDGEGTAKISQGNMAYDFYLNHKTVSLGEEDRSCRSMRTRNKDAYNSLNLNTIRDQCKNTDGKISPCSITSGHTLVLSPMALFKIQKSNRSLSSRFESKPHWTFEEVQSDLNLHSISESTTCKPFLARCQSEPALHYLSDPPMAMPRVTWRVAIKSIKIHLKKRILHLQRVSRRMLGCHKRDHQQTHPRLSQRVNVWRSPHDKKKKKVILTLMILSMWSLAFNLPMTMYLIKNSKEQSEYPASQASLPRRALFFTLIVCLGNTLLYAWRFVDYKYMVRKFQALCVCTGCW